MGWWVRNGQRRLEDFVCLFICRRACCLVRIRDKVKDYQVSVSMRQLIGSDCSFSKHGQAVTARAADRV